MPIFKVIVEETVVYSVTVEASEASYAQEEAKLIVSEGGGANLGVNARTATFCKAYPET